MKSECDKLETYLADDLSADAVTRFEHHLEECDNCRGVIQQQLWIDTLLRSSQCAPLERAPNALHQRLRTAIARRRQTTRIIACGLATAATVAVVALGWTLTLIRQSTNDPVQNNNNFAVHSVREPIDTSPPVADFSPLPRATFVSNGDTIAVPLDTTDDDVTIVQLYPTTEAKRQAQRDLALQFTLSESNGG